MSPLRLRYQTVEFGEMDVHIRTLRDTREFQDDDGRAAALGISSASWSLFGVIWASGQALARHMVDYEVSERRILELGCGIGLASLVLNNRGSDITATDFHPDAETFLLANIALNEGTPIPFHRTNWLDENSGLGRFDLIIGSDVLYDAELILPLAAFIDRHAQPACEVLIMDPGRGQRGRFSKKMVKQGYDWTQKRAHPGDSKADPYRGQLLRFRRGTNAITAEL